MKSPEILEPHQVIPLQQVLGEGLHRPRFQALPGRKTVNLFDIYISGWWYTYPSEKYECVSWDDDIPNIWKHKKNVPNHQPNIIYIYNNH